MTACHACLSFILMLSLLAIPAAAQAASPAQAETEATAPEHVLFIGNSHTRRNGGLDRLVAEFVAAEAAETAETAADDFEGEVLTEAGVTLEYHWGNGAPDRIRNGDFDMVVLQGYLAGSSTGTAEPFLEHARLFDDIITGSGAETVFFMTWPRGRDDWSTLYDVIAAHRQLEAELDAAVAPAALAFARARSERPQLALIGPDLVHATPEGAYLAAATVYATLFGRSPVGSDYTYEVDPETAAFLQRIAWETLQAWEAGTV